MSANRVRTPRRTTTGARSERMGHVTDHGARQGTVQSSEVDVTDLVVHMAGVAVRRGKTTLVGDIDWSVELDERWVVLGPNGAGKTTLLRLASAELHPTKGKLHLLGERIGKTD